MTGAGSFVLYANINTPVRYSRPEDKPHIEANITKVFYGFIVYENRTIQLRKGDIVHYWIIAYFLEGGYRTLVNQTFNVETLLNETLSKTYETGVVHDANASHFNINMNDYIYSILEKINSTEIIDLHNRVPHESIPDYLDTKPSDERTSYIEKLIRPSSEWY